MSNKKTKALPRADRTLILDIETAPKVGYVWGLWKQNIGLSMLKGDWYVMAWCAKWLDEEDIFYEDQSHLTPRRIERDKGILKNLHGLLDQADFVIAHNGRKFDVPSLNSRFLLNGMKPPSPYRMIDTLDIAKKHFRFTSNKLEYLSGVLSPDAKKSKHEKFPGFELWSECMQGNPEAWQEMQDYNVMDVVSLEEVYKKLRPYYDTHPNVGLFYEDKNPRCKCCGSTRVTANGWRHTNVGKYQRFRCQDCGAYSRGGSTQVAKEVRKNMLR